MPPKRRIRRPSRPEPQLGVDTHTDTESLMGRPRLRVAIYVRISTSLQAQKIKLAAYISSQDNWELTSTFIDQASGATTERPDLKRALAAA